MHDARSVKSCSNFNFQARWSSLDELQWRMVYQSVEHVSFEVAEKSKRRLASFFRCFLGATPQLSLSLSSLSLRVAEEVADVDGGRFSRSFDVSCFD
ncbi:hypothetical protein SAY86_015047 [Trapa natans]|uniref:Uncharacterized protein n=1 Tax=Trapa natans TaxID=22666 RepID=A0AAN7QGK6_TRANT|nr:hypothetical protein SAY86_015047 [Trapa natans]